MAPSAFWGALLLGRGLVPAVLRSHSERTIYRLGLVSAIVGTALVLTTHLVPLLLAGAAIAGLGLAAVFPITVAVLSRDLGENSQRLGGFFFAIGNMGGATIPFLVGAVSTQTHSLRGGDGIDAPQHGHHAGDQRHLFATAGIFFARRTIALEWRTITPCLCHFEGAGVSNAEGATLHEPPSLYRDRRDTSNRR